MAAERPAGLPWQASLLDAGDAVGFDPAFSGIARRELGDGAWVDHLRGWITGADTLFECALAGLAFEQASVWMYDHRVAQPRLTARLEVGALPVGLEVLSEIAAGLSRRYGVAFTRIGCNLYRDGADSVAWHGDRVARDLPEATVAIVSLGHRRPFKLRPRGGGRSVRYDLGRGDLLVMGGSCQRTWEHTVPKVARAGPRLSITLRHEYPDPAEAGQPAGGGGSGG